MADTDKEKAAQAADKKALQEQNKSEKEAANKKVVAACSIDLDNIFTQLHVKAVEQVKDCRILNSAVEGDGKNAKFHGAGSHIIAALPLKGEEIDLNTALAGIKQYVAVFNGPDVANKIKNEDLIKLEDENGEQTKKESAIPYVPSFMTYLTEENAEQKASLEKHDAAEKDKVQKKKQLLDIDKANEKASGDTTAKGFYITYKISIEGQKESPLADALKGFGAGLLKGLGIQGFSWKTGAKGKEHTIGDLLDTLDKVFGKIDPNELKTRFTKNAQAKYPQTRATDVQYYDKKTLLKYLGKKLDPKQKAKINSADYSLCYKVEANDKSKKLINVTVVADFVTRSIKGLFKKFKNKVDAKDVVLVNDYDETDKDLKKAEKKLQVNTNDKKPMTTDSLKLKHYGKMLTEAAEKDAATDKAQENNLADMKAALESNAKKALGENFVVSNVWTKEELEKNVDQTSAPDAFAAFSDKVKYAFVVETKQTTTSEKEGNEALNSSMLSSVNSLMKMLFEEADKKDDETDKKSKEISTAVNNVFKVLFTSFNKLLGKDVKPNEPTVYEVEKKQNKNESTEIRYNFVSKIFESNEFNDEISQLILEKADNGLTNDQAKQLIQLISKFTLEKIRKNKDKISNIWENRDPGKTKKNAEEYQKFSDLIFKDSVTEDEIFKFINNAKKVTQNPTRKQALTRFLAALKEADIEEPEETAETVEVNFYDVDPKTNEKDGKPLNSKPFEVEKGSKLKDNQEIVDALKEFNSKLKDEEPGEGDKEGYRKRGWNPDINDAVANDNPTEILAKYVEEDKKDEEFTVQLMYAPDQEKPNATEPILIDGEDELKVKAGEAAKLPDKMPEIAGYKFKDWGDDTEKLKNVTEDIVAVAQYEKAAIEITFIDKDPNEQKPDKEITKIEKEDGKKIELPEPPKHAGYKFKEWKPNPDEMKESGSTYATYEEDTNDEEDDVEITYMDISDPSKQDDENAYEEMEKKAKENDDDAKAPTPKDKDGWKFEKWDPDPDAMTKSGKTFAKYIKEEESKEDDKATEIHKYWICPDINGYLTSKEVSVKQNHTDVDFYIVPMKGLKMDNTDDDDSKEVEGKGK